MPEYLFPGVYVEEVDTGNKPIECVATSTVGFLGVAERGPEYTRMFGSYSRPSYLTYSVEGSSKMAASAASSRVWRRTTPLLPTSRSAT